jgi:hypothetical protein
MSRAPLVDFCNRSNDPRARPRIVRTPPTAPVVAHERSVVVAGGLRVLRRGGLHRPLLGRATLSRAPSHTAANRVLTGQGPCQDLLGLWPRRLPPRSLEAGASPQPDTARTPPVASSLRRRVETAALRFAPASRSDLASPPDAARSKAYAASQGRITRLPAKGFAIRRTRGAFHRRTRPQRGRWAPSPSTSCPQPVEYPEPAPFQSQALPER